MIEEVAPLEVVSAWAEANNCKQTKSMRTRFLYVASAYPNDRFGAYVVKDSEEMFKAWDVVASTVHDERLSTPDSVLDEVRWRAAVWLYGVLTLRSN